MRSSALVFTLALCACSGPPPDRSQPQVESSPTAASTPTWVSFAVPLRRAEPGGSNEDLLPLRSSFAHARVIALGEGTHGSHEFHVIRERLLAWMITDLGVRALAIESSMAEVAELDRYIQGEGESHRASDLVARNSNWPWRIVEFAQTVEWLRAYNAGREQSERVHIYGFDIQQPWVTLDSLHESFPGRESVKSALRSPDIQRIAVTPARYESYDEDQRTATLTALVELETELQSATSDPLILRTLGTLIQVERHYRLGGDRGVSPPREEAMADNIRWIAETLHPHTPVVVWAHNGHVSRQPMHRSHGDAMGRHLADHFGEGFVNVGFFFAEGDFLAKDKREDGAPIRELSVAWGPIWGLGPRLAGAGLGRFALDLRSLPEGEPLREWLTEPRQAWVVGSAVTDPSKQIGEFELLAGFDVIVFVRAVTAARLVPRGELPNEGL